MKISESVRKFAAAMIATILAGCNAGGSQLFGERGAGLPSVGAPFRGGTDIARALAMTNRVGFVPAQHILKRSWMDATQRNELRNPHHKKRKLLYLTDVEYGSVDIIDYKSGAAVGQVTGFSYPYGDCSDKNGNVYVTDFSNESGYEIQAGTTTVINSWPTGGETIGCSVSNGGDVAFTNFYPGGVIVFPGGGPTGHSYPGPGYDWPAGYDDKGNLFVMCDYEAPCSNPELWELPAGGNAWILLNFGNGSISFPSGIEWDGKYLAFGGGSCNGGNGGCIDQVTVSGSTATIVNTVQLNGSSCGGYVDVGASWAENAKNPNGQVKSHTTAVALPNLWCFPSPILVWPYPAGGDPVRSIMNYPYQYDYAATLIEI